MKIRPLGDVLFHEYDGVDEPSEDSAFPCAWCQAGSNTDFGPDGSGVIFFENDEGKVRRVEGYHDHGVLVLECTPSTLVQAALEMGEQA